MKKYLKYLLALLLFIPFVVSAQDVGIKNISLVDSKGFVEEVSPAKAEGLNVDLDLKFREVGDEATYLLIIHNGDSEDYVLDTKLGVSSKYVEYSLDSASDDNIIKAGGDTKVYITAKYNKAVPDYLMTENKYSEIMNIKINFVGDNNIPEETSKNAVNPNTGNPIVIIGIGLFITVICAVLLKNYNVRKYTNMILILGLVLIPTTIMALKTVVIDVNSKVEIEKVEPITFYVERVYFFGESPRENYTLTALPGMTWGQWLTSSFNDKNIKMDDLANINKFSDMACKQSHFIYDSERFDAAMNGIYGDNTNVDANSGNVNNYETDAPTSATSYGDITVEEYKQIGGILLNDEIVANTRYKYIIGNPCEIISYYDNLPGGHTM